MKRILLLVLLPLGFVSFVHRTEAAARPLTRLELLEYVLDDVYPADADRYCFGDIAPSLPPSYEKLFADVTVQDAGGDEVCLGMLFGLVDGDKRNAFRPHDPINVAEAAKMLTLAYGVSLPDSEAIRVLPWHWRFTEALKRRGALARGFMDYGRIVTVDDLDAMLTALRPAKPPLLPSAQREVYGANANGQFVRVRATDMNGAPILVRVMILRAVTSPVTPTANVRSRACTKVVGRRCADVRIPAQAPVETRTEGRTIGNYKMRMMRTWVES